MSRFIIAIVSMALLTNTCNDEASSNETDRKNGYAPVLKTREDSLFHDVMEGHDAGMAKVGKLRRNINETARRLDSLNKLPASKVNAAYKQALTDVHAALNTANDEMNSWMESFKLDSASDNKELRIKYLQGEKEKVAVVKEHIFSALQQADSVLTNK
ncbi:viral A-type inclusion protein [Longitalea arenae]|uniref:viral A-type inclusion protein n=1 Tax=Longitalea arenae TaxID=2812558 RepID=UPI001967D04B|nr:viral A-type inclusion protein [Longitalea arenae]